MNPVSVVDRNGTEVFTMERFFRNKWQSFLCGVLPGFVTNIRMHYNGEQVAETIDTMKMLGRPNWDVKDVSSGTIAVLQDKSMAKTHPRASIMLNANEYKIESNFGEKETRVYLEDELLLTMTSNNILPPRKFKLEFLRDDLNEALFICLLYTYEISR